jgi:hypothetical protein
LGRRHVERRQRQVIRLSKNVPFAAGRSWQGAPIDYLTAGSRTKTACAFSEKEKARKREEGGRGAECQHQEALLAVGFGLSNGNGTGTRLLHGRSSTIVVPENMNNRDARRFQSQLLSPETARFSRVRAGR